MLKADTPRVIIDQVLSKQVALAALTDPTVTHIARKLNLSREIVKRVMDSASFRDALSEIGDEALKPAIAKAKTGAAKLVDKALQVIEDALDKGDLDAAKVVFKVIGMDHQEERLQDTHLTVVMPGATAEQIIPTQGKEITDDSI